MSRAQSYVAKGAGVFIAGDDAITGLVKPKVILVRQVRALSAAVIAQTFGVVGKPMIEGIREAMIEDIAEWPGPMCSWRESAARLIGESEHGFLR